MVENLVHETIYGRITLSSRSQLVTSPDGIACLKSDQRLKAGGKFRIIHVRLDNKPELAAKVAGWEAELDAHEAEKMAEFVKNVPGLNELEAAQEAAYNEQSRYDHEFDRMMETGHSIGPKSVDKSLQEKANALTAQYPRAALYLRASEFCLSNNSNKYAAGEDAQELIASGGNLEDAKVLLNTWVDRFVPVWGK